MPTVTAGSVDVSIIGGKGDGGGQRDRCGQPPRRTASPPAAREPVRQNARESWTEGTPTVANRTGKWSHGGSRGSGGGGRGSMRGAYLGKRPGRGSHGGRRHWSRGGNRRPY